jgi:hypothetical protein
MNTDSELYKREPTGPYVGPLIFLVYCGSQLVRSSAFIASPMVDWSTFAASSMPEIKDAASGSVASLIAIFSAQVLVLLAPRRLPQKPKKCHILKSVVSFMPAVETEPCLDFMYSNLVKPETPSATECLRRPSDRDNICVRMPGAVTLGIHWLYPSQEILTGLTLDSVSSETESWVPEEESIDNNSESTDTKLDMVGDVSANDASIPNIPEPRPNPPLPTIGEAHPEAMTITVSNRLSPMWRHTKRINS